MQRHVCPNCGIVDVGQQIGGKLALSAGGLILGNQGMKDPIAMVAFGLLGFFIGHYIDQQIAKRCPQCGAILTIADFLF
jgi:hypothetical protein